MRTRPPPSTLFPYTTLFRSVHDPQPGLAIVQHEFCLAWRGLRVVAGLGALAAGLERPDDLPIGRKRFRRQVPDLQDVPRQDARIGHRSALLHFALDFATRAGL